MAAELEWRRLLYAGDTAELEAVTNAFHDGEYAEVRDAVVDLPPATTPAGLRAKARAAVAFYDPDPPEQGGMFAAELWEVVTALAGNDLTAMFRQQRELLQAVQS